jgi:hypothetical protein
MARQDPATFDGGIPVGEIDPAGVNLDWSKICYHQSERSGDGTFFACTLAKHHTGSHVGHYYNGKVGHRWSNISHALAVEEGL